MLARLLAVADDVDAGVLLQFYRDQRGVVLGGGKLFALQAPRRPQLVRLREPGGFRQAAGDGGGKQHQVIDKRRGRAPIIKPIVVPQQPRSAHDPHRRVARDGADAGEVIAAAVAGGQPLHFPGARAPHRAIGAQRRRRVVRHLGEALRHDRRILDRHGGALGQIGQHRMGSVPNQRHRALRPVQQRPAVEQRPFQPGFRLVDQAEYLRRHALDRQARQQLIAASRRAPARRVPAVVDDDDDIDEGAVLDRVVHDMGFAPEPQMDQRRAEFRRRLLGRQQRPPGGAPGKARRLAITHARARDRPQPVGGDDRVAALVPDAAAAARRDGDAVVMGDEIFHPHAEPQADVEVLGDG